MENFDSLNDKLKSDLNERCSEISSTCDDYIFIADLERRISDLLPKGNRIKEQSSRASQAFSYCAGKLRYVGINVSI